MSAENPNFDPLENIGKKSLDIGEKFDDMLAKLEMLEKDAGSDWIAIRNGEKKYAETKAKLDTEKGTAPYHQRKLALKEARELLDQMQAKYEQDQVKIAEYRAKVNDYRSEHDLPPG